MNSILLSIEISKEIRIISIKGKNTQIKIKNTENIIVNDNYTYIYIF
jgi:hypothetical protein